MSKLHISNKAKMILGNFGGFNQSITINNDVIHTAMLNYGLGEYRPTTEDIEIDQPLSLIDVNNFLSLVGNETDIDIEQHEFFANIKFNNQKIQYGITEEALTPSKNTKLDEMLKESENVLTFKLTIDTIQNLKKYKGILNISDIKTVYDDEGLKMKLYNQLQDGNKYEIPVEEFQSFDESIKEVKFPKNALNDKELSIEKLLLDNYTVNIMRVVSGSSTFYFIEFLSENFPLRYVFIGDV